MIISFSRGRNAIWGGATLGFIIGAIIAIFQKFNWSILYKTLIIVHCKINKGCINFSDFKKITLISRRILESGAVVR